MYSYAVGFIVNNLWIVLFGCASIFHYFLRSGNNSALTVSVVLTAVFALSQVIYVQWLLPFQQIISIYYLYWAGISGITAAILYLMIRSHRIANYWPAKLAVALLSIEFCLGIALHIDRNVLALNGAIEPNNSLSRAWWLWQLRDMVLSFNNLVILLCLILPFGKPPLRKLFPVPKGMA